MSDDKSGSNKTGGLFFKAVRAGMEDAHDASKEKKDKEDKKREEHEDND